MSKKLIHILSFDWGGAAIATLRLHEAMLNIGLDSKVLVKWQSKKNIKHSYVYQEPPIKYTFKKKIYNKYSDYRNRLLGKKTNIDYLKNAPEGFHQFTIPEKKFNIENHPLVKEADIIHLHWVADFVNYKTFFKTIDKPIVWTMHDMNPFTGGCHYSMDCEKYESACPNCPQLQGTINPDKALDIQETKKYAFKNSTKLTIITPSQWLFDCSKKSSLLKDFPHYVINNGFDTDIFKIRDKMVSRDLLGLPKDKNILLFVAGNLKCKPKGYDLLLDAFEKLSDKSNVLLCAIGENKTGINNKNIIELASVNDERLMSCVYSAADVFITPSLADNYPNTIVEAQLCGIPVIGFPIGGIKEMINNEFNGLLCKEISSVALSESIYNFLENKSKFNSEIISKYAQEQHSSYIIAEKYNELYNKILKEV